MEKMLAEYNNEYSISKKLWSMWITHFQLKILKYTSIPQHREILPGVSQSTITVDSLQ